MERVGEASGSLRSRLSRTKLLISGHLRPLLALIIGIYGPVYMLYAAVGASGAVPDEATDMVFGFVLLFLLPIVNGMLVVMLATWDRGATVEFDAVFRAGRLAWSRLLTVYVSVAFILMAYLALTLLPVYIGMSMLKINRPYLLIPIAAVTATWVLTRYVFVDPFVVLKGTGAWLARQKSQELRRGRFWPVLGATLLAYGPALLIEEAGDYLSDWLKPNLGAGASFVSAGLGLGAALFYVVPNIFFYVWFCELTRDEAPLAVASAPQETDDGEAAGERLDR